MKASYVLTIIFTSCIVCTYERKSIGKLTNLAAVADFEGIKNFYQIVRQEKSESPPQESKQPEKNVNIKKTICENILTSNYFVDVHRADWVDVDFKENRVELKNAYPDLFQFIYRERRTLCLSFASDRSCYSYRYENNYRLLPVQVGQLAEEEYLFLCLARDRRSMKIKPYFVSQEYNVNAYRNHYPMAGRFIFGYDVHKNGTRSAQLQMLAMAEESAVGWDFLGKFIEMYYVTERSKGEPRPGARRKIIAVNRPPPAELNLRDSEARNRSLASDANKSTSPIPISNNNVIDERTSDDYLMAMPSFTDGEMYASDNTRDLKYYNGYDANQHQPWLRNGEETLDDATNEARKNDERNTTDGDKSLSTMSSGVPAVDTGLATRLREGYYDNNDPICQLTAGEKLRLCASIFASSVFRDKVKFVPTTENVQLKCEKKQISLIAEVAAPPPLLARLTQWELRENGRNSYEESMFGCRALTRDKNYKMTYLVSRGNYDNSVFVYTHKFSDRRVFVYNYFNNTSVI